MSKRRNNRSRNTRDTSVITSRRERFPKYLYQPSLFDTITLEDLSDLNSLRELQDSRDTLQKYRTLDIRGLPAALTHTPQVHHYVSPFIGFEEPTKVLTCVRRSVRKKMMFAFNQAGKGGQRRPRRNINSDVRC